MWCIWNMKFSISDPNSILEIALMLISTFFFFDLLKIDRYLEHFLVTFILPWKMRAKERLILKITKIPPEPLEVVMKIVENEWIEKSNFVDDIPKVLQEILWHCVIVMQQHPEFICRDCLLSYIRILILCVCAHGALSAWSIRSDDISQYGITLLTIFSGVCNNEYSVFHILCMHTCKT